MVLDQVEKDREFERNRVATMKTKLLEQKKMRD